MSNDTKPAAELSNGQAVNGTAPIPSVMPPEIRQLHDLGALSAHIQTHNPTAPPAPADASEQETATPNDGGGEQAPPEVELTTENIGEPQLGNIRDLMSDEVRACYDAGVLGIANEGALMTVWEWYAPVAKTAAAAGKQVPSMPTDFPVDPRSRRDGINVSKNKANETKYDLDPIHYGRHIAERYNTKTKWRFDRKHGGWHRWDETHWENGWGNAEGDDAVWLALMDNISSVFQRGLAEPKESKIMKAVKDNLKADMPLRIVGRLPVLNGVVDLFTGDFRAHDPLLDVHREVVPVEYCPDWSDADCWNLVRGYLSPAGIPLFDDTTLGTLLTTFGIALSGRAPALAPIVIIIGDSGAGKTGVINFLTDTLGGMAAPFDDLHKHLTAANITAPHNAALTDLIAKQQLICFGSDITGVFRGRLYEVFGNQMLSSRYPGAFGALITGKPIAQLVFSTVEEPQMSASEGAWRRSTVIKITGERIPDEVKRESTLNERRALLTLGVRVAMKAIHEGYTMPTASDASKQEFFDNADPERAHVKAIHETREGGLRGISLEEIGGLYHPSEGRKQPKLTVWGRIVASPDTMLGGNWKTTAENNSRNHPTLGIRPRQRFCHPTDQPPTPEDMRLWAEKADTAQVKQQAAGLLN